MIFVNIINSIYVVLVETSSLKKMLNCTVKHILSLHFTSYHSFDRLRSGQFAYLVLINCFLLKFFILHSAQFFKLLYF